MVVNKDVRVGIADLGIVKSPSKVITMGLGSCIGITMYDSKVKIAGLAHIMLPDSKQFKDVNNPLKYADLAIPILYEKMISYGCYKKNIVVKIAGGASMFNFTDKSVVSDVGRRNGEACIQAIEKLGISIVAKDIGGNKGRTMTIDSEDGKVTIKSVGVGIKEI